MTDKKTTQTFNQVPTDILDNKELSLLDKFIYGEVFTMSVQGKDFFMSNSILAERYGKSKVTISRSVNKLSRLGYIHAEMTYNDKQEIEKRVLTLSSKTTIPLIKNDNTPLSKTTRGIITSDKDNKSINKSTEYTNVQSKIALESDFEKLWKLYPNKKGKELALKAYKKAIKAGATNKEIQTGIVNLKNEIAFKETDKKYIPHGGTWFNQKRWEDDYENGNVEQSSGYQANEIARLENELQNSSLNSIERSFMSKKLAELKERE